MSKRILLVPSVAKGNGSGHLVRCFSLARELGPEAAVFVPEAKTAGAWSAAELSLAYSRELSGIPLVSEPRGDESWDLVLLDRRASSLEELAFWERLGPVLALDEGGAAREAASYLVDVLPRVRPRRPRSADLPPNRASIGFLDLPSRRREPPAGFSRILVSFGGEDPAGLALVLARSLVTEGLVQADRLTLVSGALRRGAPPLGLEGATVLGPIQDLKEHLHQYDLVFTQFGLTAFEAAYAGCGVILLNPSAYHRRLAKTAGFPEIGLLKPELKALRRHLANPAETLAMTAAVAPEERESLADFIAGLAPSGPRLCPRCGSPERRAVFRNESKSYFRCGDCGIVYLLRFARGRENPYKEAYFFDEYRAQYGKSYLEDWPALTRHAVTRLDRIEALAERSLGRRRGLSILDVGCAYGPFLAAARERGQEPFGLDAADEAARYVRKELGIPAAAGDFLDPAVAAAFGGPFDVVSMWYVIEHFDDLDRALRNAAALLRPGGIFAFSTPSGEGVSARRDRGGFFERSPQDHFTIWEPSRVGGILRAYGFRVERIKITGHHPERFPALKRLREGFLRRGALGVFGSISRLFGLGDTFEVYAVRESAGVGSPRASSPASRARAKPES
ncbi:MAG: class I SAM-dependent methyltransferase [Spirochaetaceae bacterium]|nr:class I SAM-dependent methyltransferase [Spirochaetaceae bacterium]